MGVVREAPRFVVAVVLVPEVGLERHVVVVLLPLVAEVVVHLVANLVGDDGIIVVVLVILVSVLISVVVIPLLLLLS